MPGHPGHSTRPHARLPPSFLDMDACTTSQLNVALIRKLLCAWFIFDMLSISVCTTRHWQTSGQLVQELNLDHCIFRIPISWIEQNENAFYLQFEFKVMPSQCLLTRQLHWSFKFHDTCFILRTHISTHNKYSST